METTTKGTYLFKIYDCNDESRMKVIRQYQDYCESAAEVDERANWLFDNTGIEETGWCQIYKLCGSRQATLKD